MMYNLLIKAVAFMIVVGRRSARKWRGQLDARRAVKVYAAISNGANRRRCAQQWYENEARLAREFEHYKNLSRPITSRRIQAGGAV